MMQPCSFSKPGQENKPGEVVDPPECVQVFITTTCRPVDGESTSVQRFIEGEMFSIKKKSKDPFAREYILRYNTDPTGFMTDQAEKMEIILHGPRTVDIISSGQNRYTLYLKKGKGRKTVAQFEADDLCVDMEVETINISWEIQKDEGNIELIYRLLSGGSLVSENEVKIYIRPMSAFSWQVGVPAKKDASWWVF